MKELIQYKKPFLAELSEKPKLKALSDEEKLKVVIVVVYDLLNLLAVKNNLKEHTVALAKHICKSVDRYSEEQIRYAFTLYSNGELGLEVFQTLNAVVFGKVMKAFDKYEQEKLKNYRLKIQEFKNKAEPMTQQEKDEIMEEAIEQAFSTYKTLETINLPSPKYDYLDSKGKLQEAFKMTNEQWKEYKLTKYAKVQAELKEKYQNKKASSRDEKHEFNNIVSQLENKKNGLVITECKKQILESYFDLLR